MAFEPKVNIDLYTDHVRTIEAHTSGEYCRVALDCPEMQGNTMIERKHYLQEHHDDFRTMLMYEPRGHHDMFGAILCEPVHEEADYGIFFLDGGGWLNMCGHCSIGAATVILEAGLMEMKEPQTTVKLDAPAGVITLVADCKDGKVTGVTLTNVPSFVYKKDLKMEYQGKEVTYDISFGGSFFIMVDTEKNFGIKVGPDTAKFLKDFSSYALEEVNKTVDIQHPELDITTADLVENYSTVDDPEPDMLTLRNLVVFGEASDPQLDRSPCGTGTSAKQALLHSLGELDVDVPFTYESFISTKFIGRIKEETKVGDYDAVIPTVKGAAYLCGEATWFCDPDDPMTKGFVVPQ